MDNYPNLRHRIERKFKTDCPIDAEGLLTAVGDYFTEHPTHQINLELRPSVKTIKVNDAGTWAYIYIPEKWLFQAMELFTRQGISTTYAPSKRFIELRLL